MFSVQKTMDFCRFPELSNLKELDVRLEAEDDESLLELISLLKVSPFLQKFILRLHCRQNRKTDTNREVKKAKKFCHNHLKVVEFYGFIGRAIDIELAMYFLENAVALEKIVINRGSARFPESAMNLKENRAKLSARKNARLLAKRLLPRVSMEIN